MYCKCIDLLAVRQRLQTSKVRYSDGAAMGCPDPQAMCLLEGLERCLLLPSAAFEEEGVAMPCRTGHLCFQAKERIGELLQLAKCHTTDSLGKIATSVAE